MSAAQPCRNTFRQSSHHYALKGHTRATLHMSSLVPSLLGTCVPPCSLSRARSRPPVLLMVGTPPSLASGQRALLPRACTMTRAKTQLRQSSRAYRRTTVCSFNLLERFTSNSNHVVHVTIMFRQARYLLVVLFTTDTYCTFLAPRWLPCRSWRA